MAITLIPKMMIHFKPCPFCASSLIGVVEISKVSCAVRCLSCGATGAIALIREDPQDAIKESADVWNTRLKIEV